MIEQWFAIGIAMLVCGIFSSLIFYILFQIIDTSTEQVASAIIAIFLLISLCVFIWGIFQTTISGLIYILRWAF